MDLATSIMYALAGGALLGLAASVLLLFNGRILGISGITNGLLNFSKGDIAWRLAFFIGLFVAGILAYTFAPQAFSLPEQLTNSRAAIAGLLVGFGAVMGSGCTSGHGICGISRFSPRSIVATVTFMATGAATVFVVNHVIG